MVLYSWDESWWIEMKGREAKRKMDILWISKKSEIILFLLIKFHIGMARMPRMLSNLHHSCHNNALNHRVWISSRLLLYKLHDRLLGGKHYTCHIRAFDLFMMTSFIPSHSSLQKPGVRQQSKSIATAQRNPKLYCFRGSKLNKRARGK